MNLVHQYLKNTCSSNGLLNRLKQFACISFNSNNLQSNASLTENRSYCSQSLLVPTPNLLISKLQCLTLNQTREYKLKTRLRKRCKSCKFVWRCGRLYVECEEHPRHKQHHMTSMLRGFDNVAHGFDKKSPYNKLY